MNPICIRRRALSKTRRPPIFLLGTIPWDEREPRFAPAAARAPSSKPERTGFSAAFRVPRYDLSPLFCPASRASPTFWQVFIKILCDALALKFLTYPYVLQSKT